VKHVKISLKNLLSKDLNNSFTKINTLSFSTPEKLLALIVLFLGKG